MAGLGFTRDEVILALDVLYRSDGRRLGPQSPEILALSELLNQLPIHPLSSRKGIFRNPQGVLDQILDFRRSYSKGTRNPHVGKLFYQVAEEFEGRQDELHAIAEAIRKNADAYQTGTFGSSLETENFPEGALLGHLHRVIELRDGGKLVADTCCAVCQIETSAIYPHCGNLLTLHLTVPVTALDARKRYGPADFLTVCPNCHAALHCKRPWLTKETGSEILL